MSFDETLDFQENHVVTALRLRALLLDFMRAEGLSDLGFTFSACLVDVQGKAIEKATVAKADMLWQDVGDDWSYAEHPTDIIPFPRKKPK